MESFCDSHNRSLQSQQWVLTNDELPPHSTSYYHHGNSSSIYHHRLLQHHYKQLQEQKQKQKQQQLYNYYHHHSSVSSSSFQLPSPSPTKCLMEKIQVRDWDGVRERVAYYPWDTQYRSPHIMNDASALHLVCLYRAPRDIVEMVLDAHPQALHYQDKEGWTPIHVTLLYGAEEEIVLLLIRKGGAKAVAIQSRLVGSPLHLACRHDISIHILQELCHANPSMACTANEFGTKPAKILWNQYMRDVEKKNKKSHLYQHLRHFHHDNYKHDDDDECGNSKHFVNLMNRLSILLEAVNHPRNKQSLVSNATSKNNKLGGSAPILHRVVAASHDLGLGNLCPLILLLVRLYPEQVRTIDDCTGNLPLHIAVSKPLSSEIVLVSANHPNNGRKRTATRQPNQPQEEEEEEEEEQQQQRRRQRRGRGQLLAFSSPRSNSTNTTNAGGDYHHHHVQNDPVQILLQEYPEAAKIRCQNQGDDAFPLHIALSQGHRTWKTGIQSLIEQAPETLLVQDTLTNLFPFQLAAMIPTSSCEEDIARLETTFQLLIASPHLILS